MPRVCMSHFPEILQNFSEYQIFCSFSCFNIEIANSNFTFCGAWTPSFCVFSWKLSQIQENEHTPVLLLRLKESPKDKTITTTTHVTVR